jgi:hypothetical protein
MQRFVLHGSDGENTESRICKGRKTTTEVVAGCVEVIEAAKPQTYAGARTISVPMTRAARHQMMGDRLGWCRGQTGW